MQSFDIKNFDEEVIRESDNQPVVVDFWAPWCGPCQYLGPLLEKLSRKAGNDWKLAKVNTQEMPGEAQRWGVSGIPALKIFKEGKIVAEHAGAMPEDDLQNWINENIPGKEIVMLRKAFDQVKKGESKNALASIEGMGPEEGDSFEKRYLLSGIVLFTDPEKSLELIKPFNHRDGGSHIGFLARAFTLTEEDLPYGEVRGLVLNGLEFLKTREFNESLAHLIQSIMIDKDYHGEYARKLIVAIFHLLGEDHEHTINYRRKFSMALY